MKQTEFVSYLRTFSVLSILLCHLVSENPSSYVQMTAQFFNIGVELFIIISGFCFGLQGEIKDWRKWYGKRARRIYIPYELFLIVLFVVYFIRQIYLLRAKIVTYKVEHDSIDWPVRLRRS